MKRLYLLRHAEALSTASDDQSRPLSEHGKEQARALHEILKERGYRPDAVACSQAVRTRETLDNAWPIETADFPDNFYNASPGDLLAYIHTLDSAYQSLLIVNHNPTIHKLAFMLAGKGHDTDIQSLAMGYQPCTMSVIDCDVAAWSDIVPGDNTLTDLILPQR